MSSLMIVLTRIMAVILFWLALQYSPLDAFKNWQWLISFAIYFLVLSLTFNGCKP